eukprot:1157779-Pelagomonas_calceolata.AAC.13
MLSICKDPEAYGSDALPSLVAHWQVRMRPSVNGVAVLESSVQRSWGGTCVWSIRTLVGQDAPHCEWCGCVGELSTTSAWRAMHTLGPWPRRPLRPCSVISCPCNGAAEDVSLTFPFSAAATAAGCLGPRTAAAAATAAAEAAGRRGRRHRWHAAGSAASGLLCAVCRGRSAPAAGSGGRGGVPCAVHRGGGAAAAAADVQGRRYRKGGKAKFVAVAGAAAAVADVQGRAQQLLQHLMTSEDLDMDVGAGVAQRFCLNTRQPHYAALGVHVSVGAVRKGVWFESVGVAVGAGVVLLWMSVDAWGFYVYACTEQETEQSRGGGENVYACACSAYACSSMGPSACACSAYACSSIGPSACA